MFFTKKIYQTNSICPFHLLYTVKEYQKISMGCGISKTKMFKEMYQSYWNFHSGGSCWKNVPSVQEVLIFFGTTQKKSSILIFDPRKQVCQL